MKQWRSTQSGWFGNGRTTFFLLWRHKYRGRVSVHDWLQQSEGWENAWPASSSRASLLINAQSHNYRWGKNRAWINCFLICQKTCFWASNFKKNFWGRNPDPGFGWILISLTTHLSYATPLWNIKLSKISLPTVLCCFYYNMSCKCTSTKRQPHLLPPMCSLCNLVIDSRTAVQLFSKSGMRDRWGEQFLKRCLDGLPLLFCDHGWCIHLQQCIKPNPSWQPWLMNKSHSKM